jgi:hypothetical protein
VLARSLEECPAFKEAWAKGKIQIPAQSRADGFLNQMAPMSGAPQRWVLPTLQTPGELAQFLGLTPAELEWFADVRLLNPRSREKRLRQYTLQWRVKPDGSVRLLEAPKRRLKALQTVVLRKILELIPVHEAAHGFRRGHSIRTFAAPHVGRHVVLRVDIRQFFPSITRARILALWMAAGYPEPVALRLAALCTTRMPVGALETLPVTMSPESKFALRQRHEIPHLPQGAPTSPTLANLVAFKLDCRLSGLAISAGATYTRYADDLLFSGDADFAAGAERLLAKVGAILIEEGFEANMRKNRVQRRGVSQRAVGMVLNVRMNPPREEYDRLKAILHNCVKKGPASQNRENHGDFQGHLLGRIAHIEWLNPEKAARLRRSFEKIVWD